MTTPSLHDVQRWIRCHIRLQEAARGIEDDLLNLQRGTPGVERMAVYASGYHIRIREALAEVYEAIRHLLGHQTFATLVQDYSARHPSNVYNLTFVGRELPVFLQTYPLTERLPFLPDLARLEWAVCLAFHASDVPPLDAARLSTVPPEAQPRMRLMFHPAMGLVASAWPVLDLWEARHQPRESIDVPLLNRPQRVLVSRRGFEVRCESLTQATCELLEALQDGATLGTSCERLGVRHPLAMAEWFSAWMQAGLIVGYEMDAAA